MRDIGDPSAIGWTTGPVRKQLPAVPICRAKPHMKLTYVLLSGTWVGIRVHSIDRRDTPCLGERCPHIWEGFHRSSLQKWYTDGYSLLTKRPVLVEATEGAMAPHLDVDGFPPLMTRGLHVELSRVGPAAHSPAVLRVCPASTDPNDLPPAFDVRGALLRNWMGDTMRK